MNLSRSLLWTTKKIWLLLEPVRWRKVLNYQQDLDLAYKQDLALARACKMEVGTEL